MLAQTLSIMDTVEYFEILLPLALILVCTKLFSLLGKKIGLPQVVGMLVAGILLGLIKLIPDQTVFTQDTLMGLSFLAKIGVVLIMFSAGIETDLKQFKSCGAASVVITVLGVIAPMGLGFLVATAFNGGFENIGANVISNLFYGTILAATSVSVTVATLKELGKLNSKVGTSIITAAILDDIIGVIHEKDFHAARYRGQSDLAALITPVLYTTGNTKISDLLRILQRKKAHMVVVVDEYGGTEGLCTLEDIVEELVGEIWDEHDEVIEEFKKQPDGSYIIACHAALTDLYDLFALTGECEANTVSGWVMEQIGRVPEEGDRFQSDGLDVTVTKVDHRRVLEIRVVVLDREEEQ